MEWEGEEIMNLTINKNIRDNQKLREGFIQLAIETFDLSFESWYQNGYWTDKYIPYIIVDEENVVANASVNIIDTMWDNHPKRYIQVGTVMTKTAYRNKGLSRHIMEEILRDWKNNCDAIYLFANDTVLDFYPKFGFVKETEYQYTMPIAFKGGNAKKLDMTNSEDRDLLRKYYAKANPFSALPMHNNYGLLMFYCSAFMKDCVFYCEEFDAIVIATQDHDTLTCYDIYCDSNSSMVDILSSIASTNANSVILGFTPKDIYDGHVKAVEGGDDTLFIFGNKDNIFAHNKVMFPSLSHA